MYRSGDHYCICDMCGFRGLRSKMLKNWEGLIVHPRCFEARHPQELIRASRDKITVKDSRPEGTDVYLSVGEVTREDL